MQQLKRAAEQGESVTTAADDNNTKRARAENTVSATPARSQSQDEQLSPVVTVPLPSQGACFDD
jgi:hypothetical protein